MDNNIGNRIKLRREELDLTQDELAQKLGYKSRSSINKIELGNHDLTLKNLKSIADALSVSPYYIMGWDLSSDNLNKHIEEIFGKLTSEVFELMIKLDIEQKIELKGVIKQMLRENNKNVK